MTIQIIKTIKNDIPENSLATDTSVTSSSSGTPRPPEHDPQVSSGLTYSPTLPLLDARPARNLRACGSAPFRLSP
ncbi:MAG: hypothetical protein QOG57_6748 [Pseudonocardiales bacterium]|jgi:hypothetical protein|nr:hypothetical protein [Pseudonocardiales bacterium]